VNGPQIGISVIGVNDPGAKTLAWNQLLSSTYELYRKRFWTFFRMAVLPAIVAYCFGYGWRVASRWVLHRESVPRGSIQWALVGIVNGWGSGAGFWTISAFFFAAVATSVLGTKTDELPAVADTYTIARSRLGVAAKLALLTWTLFWIGRTIAGIAVLGPFIGRISSRYFWIFDLIMYVLMLLLAGLLSRFGLAVPELIRNPDVSLRQAIRKSLRQSGSWELFFILFLAKSAIAGYCLYWLAGLGMDSLWERGLLTANLYSWIDWLLYICIAAILEPPLFIAFSLLYCAKNPEPTESSLRS
jgi:hypothetical protein